MGGSVEARGPDLVKDGVAWAELAEGEIVSAQAEGEAVLVVRRGQECFVVGAACTHYGAPLADGVVEGGTIRCPWHHARFDLVTGEASGPPALDALPCWQVERRGERLYVLGRKLPGASLGGNPRRIASSSLRDVVIVGGGPAGAAAAEMLRREGFEGTITLFAPERSTPIDRPNLSKDYLAGKAPEAWLPVRPLEVLVEHGIDVRRIAVRAITGKRALFDGGSAPFDALLIATGATPIRLPIPGAERAFVLRTLEDTRAIVSRAGRRAVIVGASFIGLEVAASLVARGIEVDVIGRERVPLERVLGPELGALVRDVHARNGVRFHLGEEVRAIDERGVVLDDRRVDGDLVVMGVGVRPDVALAERAGLAVDHGIVVDDQFRTSVPGIWAAGDVARFPYGRAREPVRIEHWVVAQQQGQAAARSMLGKGRPFDAVPFFWSAHFDVTIGYVGHAESWDRVDVVGSVADADCAVAFRRRGETLAVAAVGRDALLLRASAALERGDEATLAQLVPGGAS